MASIEEIFATKQQELAPVGYTFYSKKITDSISTLVLYNTISKGFAVFTYTGKQLTRTDMFLCVGEDKAEKLGKKVISPYTVYKNEEGFWVVKALQSSDSHIPD